MQHWLSGYANWYAKRNRRTGHLFQGRYKAFPVEDEGYYWDLSRYIHLNPFKEGLANPPDSKLERLRDWVYGGEDFLKRMLAMASGEDEGANRRRRRRMVPVTVDAILEATSLQYGTSADAYCSYRSSAGGRVVAAMLCRRSRGRDTSRVVGSIRIEPSRQRIGPDKTWEAFGRIEPRGGEEGSVD